MLHHQNIFLVPQLQKITKKFYCREKAKLNVKQQKIPDIHKKEGKDKFLARKNSINTTTS